MRGNPIVILLVEDEPAHAEIVTRGFEDSRLVHRLFHVADGQAALDFLYRSGEFKDADSAPRPNLILLDLRLPSMDGLEVLKIIKADPDLGSIPVVILTTSAAESDMAKAYDSHASSYLVKPMDFQKFAKLMDALGMYWMEWNQYPS
jgi:two-component system response regulator